MPVRILLSTYNEKKFEEKNIVCFLSRKFYISVWNIIQKTKKVSFKGFTTKGVRNYDRKLSSMLDSDG